MIVTKQALARRTFVRGAGVTLAIPLLDAMTPALTAISKTPAQPITRLGIVYVPNGMAMEYWTPATEGTQFELRPILQPLSAFRDQLTVLSGLNGPRGGNHAGASTGFLTGVGGRDDRVEASASMDQIVASELARHTQLASLELGLDQPVTGTCDARFSCSLTNTISWRTPTTPLPMENNPRAVFERLFGDSGTTDPSIRRARRLRDRSILDSVRDTVADLERRVGVPDRTKIREYLDAVRDIERRIQKAEEQSEIELPIVAQPPGIPATFQEHARLMFDLQVLAYQCDLTRVTSFMIGRELTGRTYTEIGVAEAHHPLSHHQYDPERIAHLAKVNTYHATLFAEYLEKLRSTPDGDGTLLDHLIILYGAGISDGNSHSHDGLPILLVGGAAGRAKGGRHLKYRGDPTANLLVSLMDWMGVRVDRIGNSGGKLQIDTLGGL